MTDAAPITLELLGPGPEYKGLSIWLPQLFMETSRTGTLSVENRTFIDCLIEGPAVLLPLEACHFDSCDMGDAKGDPRTLLLEPRSPERVTGTIPLRNCRFERCRFLGVGFTGSKSYLDHMVEALSGAPK